MKKKIKTWLKKQYKKIQPWLKLHFKCYAFTHMLTWYTPAIKVDITQFLECYDVVEITLKFFPYDFSLIIYYNIQRWM